MKIPHPALLVLLALPMIAIGQVQAPASQIPAGESRLPTERPPPEGARAGGDDCRRQTEAVRQQFDLQEQALRREMTDRIRQASDAEKERLRAETERRLASLKAEAAEAQRRVKDVCGG